jgi:hypothetical protein
MTLRDRLLNVAKAELLDAARKLKTSAQHLVSDSTRGVSTPDPEEEAVREEIRREEAARRAGRRAERAQQRAAAVDVPPDVRRFYANLELPIGADADEVKAAYRRLMRRYHPDKHALDPARAKVATEVTQQLRSAYEGLMAHLGVR